MNKSALFLGFIAMVAVLVAIFWPGKSEPPPLSGVEVMVLGIAQDAGYPHINCTEDHCRNEDPFGKRKHFVSSLAVIDTETGERFLFDATPDITHQLNLLNDVDSLKIEKKKKPFDGIFLTHAHIGHYAGLMYLGREAMGADAVPVYAMPRMKNFLETNGPWSQLASLKNIELKELNNKEWIVLNKNISVMPFQVPHRDEYSETVGFLVKGPDRSFLYLPDIDKWEKWDEQIEDYISQVDYAFIDATFYKDGEIKGRAMSEIPHPFVEETMELLKELHLAKKKKVIFIHMNHSNPALPQGSPVRKEIEQKGFKVAMEGMRLPL